MARKRADPDRFLEYEEFKDHSGFTIYEAGDYIDFYYDQYRGWFDEFGNYYNSNGEPTRPNQNSLKFWDSIKYKYAQDDIDDLLNQYDGGTESEDENDDDFEREYHNKAHMDKLIKRLKHYGDQEEIKIRFSHNKWNTKDRDIIQLMGAQNVKSVQFDYQHGTNYKTGTGTIIAFNKKCAEQIIQQHNIEINGQTISLEIDALDINDSDDEVIGIQKEDPLLSKPQQQVQQVEQQQQQQQQHQQQQQQHQQQQQQQHQQQQQQQEKKQQQQQQQKAEVWEKEFLIVEGFPNIETKESIKQWLNQKIFSNEPIQDDQIEVKIREKPLGKQVDKYFAAKLDLGSKKRIEDAKNLIEKSHNMYQGKRKIFCSVFKPQK